MREGNRVKDFVILYNQDHINTVIPPCPQGEIRFYRYDNVQELSWYSPDSTGDVNSDGNVSLTDIVYLTNYLFKGGPRPHPMWRADVNWDCKVSLSDIVYLINYLFKSGPTLPGCKSSCWNCVNYPVR